MKKTKTNTVALSDLTGEKGKAMTRQQKYPDTATFHYHNQNPKNRITGDCAIRAISLATEIPYNDVVMGLAKMQCITGYDAVDCIGRYMESIGWRKHKQPRYEDGSKFTGNGFCTAQQSLLFGDGNTGNWNIYPDRRIVANIGGHHMVAIIDGKVNDIWNSTGGCIGNYWTKAI